MGESGYVEDTDLVVAKNKHELRLELLQSVGISFKRKASFGILGVISIIDTEYEESLLHTSTIYACNKS